MDFRILCLRYGGLNDTLGQSQKLAYQQKIDSNAATQIQELLCQIGRKKKLKLLLLGKESSWQTKSLRKAT